MVYQLSKNESERFDSLKAIMCLMVMFIHAYKPDLEIQNAGYYLTYVISRIICDCAVPVFAVISSIMLYRKEFSWKDNAEKKFRSIVIPYLIFNTLWILMVYAKSIVLKEECVLASYNILDWLNAYLGFRYDYKPLLSVLWYLRDLYILNLFAVIIKNIVDRIPGIVLVATIVIWISGVNIPFIQPYSAVFFVLGYYIVKYNFHLDMLDNGKAAWWLLFATILLLSYIIITDSQQVFIHRILILLFVIDWLGFSRYCRPKSGKAGVLWKNLINASFFIYLAHRFVFSLFDIFIDCNSIPVYLFTYFLKPIIAGISLTLIYLFLERYAPKTLAVITGGRKRRQSY